MDLKRELYEFLRWYESLETNAPGKPWLKGKYINAYLTDESVKMRLYNIYSEQLN